MNKAGITSLACAYICTTAKCVHERTFLEMVTVVNLTSLGNLMKTKRNVAAIFYTTQTIQQEGKLNEERSQEHRHRQHNIKTKEQNKTQET